MSRFLVLTIVAFVLLPLVNCSGVLCEARGAPCPTGSAVFSSSCGVTQFTSTCANPGGCFGAMCTITANTAQTCDASFVLGDGTTHTAHLVFSDPSSDTCDCPSTPFVALSVDGTSVQSGSKYASFRFESATCHESDAGLDGSADSALDAPAE